MAAAAAKTRATRANTAKQKPVEHVVLPKPDDVEQESKSPYPKGVRVYAYQPKDGSDPILLAMNGFDLPDKVWHFDLAQLPILSQTWQWMERAKIPKDIQRRACALPDSEYFGMFDEWFDAMKVLQGGAPRGAVTSGK